MSKPSPRRRPSILDTSLEDDPSHHLTGPFLPQTPLGSVTPARTASPVLRRAPTIRPVSPWIRWAIDPWSALQILVIPVVAYFNWELLTPVLNKNLQPALEPYLNLANYTASEPIRNPFASFFLLSNLVPSSTSDEPRYAKGWGDLLFIAYHIVLLSLVRQVVTINICRPIARYFGIKKEVKLDRFGEQGYAVVYFAFMGTWGYRIMTQLPTYWYQTEYFWIDYPHWDMKPELKRYYLTQMSYWAQQLLVLVLRLEKPRKDFRELVAHHIVTIWLVGWSYLINLTLIGNAVYMSMDIPDAFLAFSKVLNYIQWTNAKVMAFVVFVFVWSYFRHFLNFKILWSVWYEYDLIPETSRQWVWAEGTYLNWWMKYQVFVPILLLQFLNLFWYYLIWRILIRAIVAPTQVDDVRSDDEGDGDDDDEGPAVQKKCSSEKEE
ncbi:longevity assurance proteins LAG1/LAC1 [Marasmius fiardii PR-910]|nr:longevity assurance proteins LAG1/LAC1 [Marasmius fiardii PR-910]